MKSRIDTFDEDDLDGESDDEINEHDDGDDGDDDDNDYGSNINTNQLKEISDIEILQEALERQLIFQYKAISANVPKQIDKLLNSNSDLEFFFKSQSKLYESSTIIAKPSYNDLFNSEGENILYFLAMIRDKCLQLFMEHTKPFEENIKAARELVKKNTTDFQREDITKEIALDCFMNYMKNYGPILVSYVKSMPGFNNININDLSTVIKENLPVVNAFRITDLYINDECYLIVNNVQLSKKWTLQFFGPTMCESIFKFHKNLNELRLSNYEKALLIPIIITSTGGFLVYFNEFIWF